MKEMDRISIKNVELEGVKCDNLYVFLDDEGAVIILPLLWTVHLACKSTVHVWRIKGTFDQSAVGAAKRKPEKVTKVLEEEDIAENTVKNYVGHVSLRPPALRRPLLLSTATCQFKWQNLQKPQVLRALH
jgi:hypothetical protein